MFDGRDIGWLLQVSKPSPESPLVLVTNGGGPSVTVESADKPVCKVLASALQCLSQAGNLRFPILAGMERPIYGACTA